MSASARRVVRVHRRVAVAVPRLRHRRAAPAGRRLHRTVRDASEWPTKGRFFTVRAGSLVAWVGNGEPAVPFRIVGGHTDSPNLRVKQHPDRFVSGWQVVALAALRRGVAELVARPRPRHQRTAVGARSADGIEHRLVRIDEPILRVPQLAIHLAEDRKSVSARPAAARQRGLGRWQRTALVPGVRRRAGRGRRRRRARHRPDDPRPDPVDAGRGRRRVGQRAATGQPGHLLRGPRGVPGGRTARAICRCSRCSTTRRSARQSDHGAQSELLLTVLERIALAAGGGREDFLRRLPGSMVASGDMAHATHPNYPERHEPGSPDRGQRRAGAQGAAEPALRHRRPHRRRVRAGLRAGRGAVAALRASRRPAVRVDDRADDRPRAPASPPWTSAPRSWPCTRRAR